MEKFTCLIKYDKNPNRPFPVKFYFDSQGHKAETTIIVNTDMKAYAIKNLKTEDLIS